MSELGGGGIRTCYCDLQSRRWGPVGGGTHRFRWILAAAWTLSAHAPPTPSLLYRGDPEFSMCMPCLLHVCTGVLEEPGALL